KKVPRYSTEENRGAPKLPLRCHSCATAQETAQSPKTGTHNFVVQAELTINTLLHDLSAASRALRHSPPFISLFTSPGESSAASGSGDERCPRYDALPNRAKAKKKKKKRIPEERRRAEDNTSVFSGARVVGMTLPLSQPAAEFFFLLESG
ncbi:hypothetical protein AOLI_G00247210, partial [Acnodon oligacanthus]